VSISFAYFDAGYTTGQQPTFRWPPGMAVGDLVVIYMAANRGFGIIDQLGAPLQTIDAQQMGTLCDALYIRKITGAESTLQVYAFADVPAQDKFFAVNGAWITMIFRGQADSQADGYSAVQSPSAHIMQFPDAIATQASDEIVLLGCASSVLATLDSDTVSGYTHIATSRGASIGVNAHAKTQASAGHTGVPNGTNSCGTNLICHTLCLFAAPPPSPPPSSPPPPPPSHRSRTGVILT